MVGGFDGANSFFSLFYAFEYWWSSDTVGNDLIGGEEKQKPARTPAFVWTKEVFRTWTFFVKETQINAHWAGRDSSKLELPPLFGPRCSEDRSKLLTWVELYRRNLAWSLRFSKKVCNVYINDNDSQLQVFLKNFPYFLMSLFEDFWERKAKCEKFGKIRVLLIFFGR